MTDRITIDYDSAQVIDVLHRLVAGLGPAGWRAPLKEIAGFSAVGHDLAAVTLAGGWVGLARCAWGWTGARWRR